MFLFEGNNNFLASTNIDSGAFVSRERDKTVADTSLERKTDKKLPFLQTYERGSLQEKSL